MCVYSDVDGGYGTLSNTPSSSTETLNNDDLKVDPMEVDEVASNGVDEVSSNGTVMEDLNMEVSVSLQLFFSLWKCLSTDKFSSTS